MTDSSFFAQPRRLAVAVFSILSLWFLSASAEAQWLHYRGPTMNGIAGEKLPGPLPKGGARQLWKASLGTGTSAVTVSDGHAFSMGNVANQDVVYCLDAKSGKEVWRRVYPQPLDKRNFEGGPAATPTIDLNRVYTVSHQGELFCLDAATGKDVWHLQYVKDLRGKRPQWGFAGSPTVEGNLLILDVGGKGASTVAVEKTTGKVVWKSGDDDAGYASAVVATIGGKRTAVLFKASAVVGLDVKDGRELWRSSWKTQYDVNAATPLIIGDKVFITSGYGSGCALIGISGGKATELWRNKNLKAHINSPVAFEEHVYGIDDQTGDGKLVCLALADGSLKWSEKSVAGGALILADSKLIVLTEKGELVIADASPVGFKAVSRTQVLGGHCWVQPTLAGGHVFAKNNQGEVVCVELSGK